MYPFQVCMAHNEHKRLAYDVRTMINRWHSIPPENIMLDATNLIRFSMSSEQSQETSQEFTQTQGQENKPATVGHVQQQPIDTPMDSIEVNVLNISIEKYSKAIIFVTGRFSS